MNNGFYKLVHDLKDKERLIGKTIPRQKDKSNPPPLLEEDENSANGRNVIVVRVTDLMMNNMGNRANKMSV